MGLDLRCSAGGTVDINNDQIRQSRQRIPSRTVGANKLPESLARSWWVSGLIRCCPATLRKGRGVSFPLLNRVTRRHPLYGGLRREGMAQGRATAQPCLIVPRELSTMDESAGCNRSRRNKASLGMADHWTRLFKTRSISPTVRDTPSKLLPDLFQGVVCPLAKPSGTVSVKTKKPAIQV